MIHILPKASTQVKKMTKLTINLINDMAESLRRVIQFGQQSEKVINWYLNFF